MNKSFSIVLALSLSTFSLLLAQSEEAPKPSEPILRRAPSNAQWTVSFSPKKEGGHKEGSESSANEPSVAPNQLKSLTIAKDGKTYREVSVWGDSRKTEKWIVGDLQVYETPYTKQIARAILPSSGQYAPSYSDYRRSDFEDIEWINKDNFRGLAEVNGRKVFVFQTAPAKRRLTPREQSELVDTSEEHASKETLAQPIVNSSGYTAYLDIQTQLPLYFDDGYTLHTYKFAETAPGSLTVPPQFSSEMEKWKKDLDRRKPLPKP